MDKENERIFRIYKEKNYDNAQISLKIQEELNVASILYESTKKWDGGLCNGGNYWARRCFCNA